MNSHGGAPPTTRVLVRQATDHDAERVVAVWTAAGVFRPWNDPWRDLAFAQRSPHSAVFVGVWDDAIVATVMVGEDGHRGWAYYLAVDPVCQRRGIGRAMMAVAEEWLACRGVWKLQLLIREDNAAARGFYDRLGYRDTRSVCVQKVIG